MKLKQFIIFGLCVCSLMQFHISYAQDPNVKGKLLIIGGGSRPSAIVDKIISESGVDKGGYGVILPMSSIEPDSSIYYAKRQFLDKNLENIYGLDFVKGEKLKPSKIDSIKNAKFVYISGGDQSRFMAVVRGTVIEDAIHEAYNKGSLITGTSAGAAIMSKMMITGSELKHPNYSSTFRNIESNNIEIKTGLGLITHVIIDQHFVKRSRYNRLLSAVIEHPKMTGIGIDESTAILVEGQNIEVVGDSQIIVFKNPKHSKNEQGDKLGAHGIELNIYLPGEKFIID